MSESDLYRTRLETGSWQRCTLPFFAGREDYSRYLTALSAAVTGDKTYQLFVGTADGEFYRFSPDAEDGDGPNWQDLRPAPVTTPAPPTPTPCPDAIDERFQLDDANLADKLGCAIEAGVETLVAFQPFERGMMFWRQDKREIYVLHNDATWAAYEDTWDPNQPDRDPNLAPPGQLYQPIHGFGQVWREHLGGAAAKIGWATTAEYSYHTTIQAFANGLLLKGEREALYLLYDDGTWQVVTTTF
jgi:hypothetical protein